VLIWYRDRTRVWFIDGLMSTELVCNGDEPVDVKVRRDENSDDSGGVVVGTKGSDNSVESTVVDGTNLSRLQGSGNTSGVSCSDVQREESVYHYLRSVKVTTVEKGTDCERHGSTTELNGAPSKRIGLEEQ
jgi:hypothetical protein